MNAIIKCLIYGYEFEGTSLKSWKFRLYTVDRFFCEKRGAKFNVYQGIKTMFTIPKKNNLF
ncbi:MAG: hypothetical protein QXG39_05130 [Candidatus Aenigmatarchaeota archaeon]